MKRLLEFLLVLAGGLSAQTTVYLRSSGPAAALITNAQTCTNSPQCGTTIQITAPGHGLASGCGTSQTCYVTVNAVVNSAGATYADGIRTAKYLDANHVAIYDTSSTPIGNPLTWTGTWASGGISGNPAGVSWIALVNPFTLPAGPNGWLDGPNGNLMHKLALGPGNGTTTGPNGLAAAGGLSLSGCPSACVITVTTSGYNPATATLPLQAGNYFSVFGTGTTLDSTNATSCAGQASAALPMPYTVASVSSTGWTSTPFSCSTLNNGDYTNINPHCGPAASPNGTIGGTQSCTTVSQIAYTTSTWSGSTLVSSCASAGGVTATSNPAWCWLAKLRSEYQTDDTADSGWKNIFDGSPNSLNWSPPTFGNYAISALALLVDRSNATLLRNADYFFNEPEMTGGVSWIDDESQGAGGGSGDQTQYYTNFITEALTFSIIAPYESPAHVNAHLNKIYNDVYDPRYTVNKFGVELSTTETTNGALHYSSATGTSLSAPSCAGSPLSCTLQLQNNAQAVINQNLWLGTTTLGGSAAINGTITAVSGCTGSGSCTVTAALTATPPATTTVYTVYATVIWGPSPATGAPGAVTQFTLVGATASQLNINAGDAILAGNGLYSSMTEFMCKVASVSTTTGTCYNGEHVYSTNNLTSYQVVWHFPAISVSSTGVTGSVGNPGYIWQVKHSGGLAYGAQPLLYPTQGGTNTLTGFGTVNFDTNQFGVLSAARIAMDLAAAAYDQRAIVDLAQQQSAMWDFTYAHWLGYGASGWFHDGAQYTPFVQEGETLFLWLMNLNFPAASSTPFPNTYATSSWADFSRYAQYTLLPDFYSAANTGWGQPFTWGALPSGSNMYQNENGNSNLAYSYVWYAPLWFSPSSIDAQYHINWAENILGTQSPFGVLNLLWGGEGDTGILFPLFYDPRTANSNYQTQPLQYEFALNNYTQAVSLTGAGFPINVAGTQALGMVSRTAWNNYGGSNAAATVVLGRFAPFATGHDCAGPQTGVYKRGMLFDVDEGAMQSNDCDMSVVGSSVHFGGLSASQWKGGVPTTADESTVSPVAWSSANSGSWAPQYGDQNSNYAHMCADVAGMYLSSWMVTSALKCLTDFKQTGGGWDQWVVEQDETFTASPQQIQRAIHYTQNGANAGNPGALTDNAYPTGTTQCVSACSSTSCTQTSCSTGLNSSGMLETTEQTSQGYGLITQIYSPNTIDIVWACPGSGNAAQCGLGNQPRWLGASFGSGDSDPVMIAAGSTLGTSTATALELVMVHKIMKYNGTNWDTTFHSAPLNPNTSWTGADACGTNSGIGYLRYRGNGPSAAVPSFVTATGATSACASLPYQYLLSGLSAGAYAVTLNGAPVGGSPFTVAAGDTSIEFTGTAGTLSINGSAPPPSGKPTSASGQVIASGNVVIH